MPDDSAGVIFDSNDTFERHHRSVLRTESDEVEAVEEGSRNTQDGGTFRYCKVRLTGALQSDGTYPGEVVVKDIPSTGNMNTTYSKVGDVYVRFANGFVPSSTSDGRVYDGTYFGIWGTQKHLLVDVAITSGSVALNVKSVITSPLQIDGIGQLHFSFASVYGPSSVVRPTGTNIVQGVVTLNGNPAANRTIIVQQGSYDWSATTNASGQWNIESLPGGQIVVQVLALPGESCSAWVVTVTMPPTPATVNFVVTS